MTANIKIEVTVRRKLGSDGPKPQTSTGEVNCLEEREVTLYDELETAADVIWALEASESDVVREIWDKKTGEYWDDWGWYGPYPRGDITVSVDYELTWHDVVRAIAERDDVDDPAGIYLDIHGHPRISEGGDLGVGPVLKAFFQYLAVERDIDTSYWTHGYRAGGSNMDQRRVGVDD